MIKRCLPFLALVAVLAGAMPALAQTGTDPNPGLRPIQRNTERCLPVGVALAAITQGGVVAEAMTSGPNAFGSAAGNNARNLIVYGPAAVGACADFEGFWGDGAGGSASSTLVLHGQDNNAIGGGAPVARDGVSETKRGPTRLRHRMRALTKLSEPGKYAFTAVLSVEAGSAATIGGVGDQKRDELKVPFTVEIRKAQGPRDPVDPRPEPEPVKYGAVAGVVTDADGTPIEGARVTPFRLPSIVDPGDPNRPILLPVTPIELDQNQGGGTGSNVGAITDAEGKYQMKLPVGRYAIGAMADGYALRYFDGAASLTDADPVEVEEGKTRHYVNFKLAKMAQASISGTVTGLTASGAIVPMPRAMVIAVAQDPALVPPGTRRPATYTDENGEYTLNLPPGTYAVGSAPGSNSAAGPNTPLLWWDNQEKMEDADPIALVDGDAVADIDFELR